MRPERKLSARAALALTKPGRHADGGGLYLDISKAGGRSWVYMFSWEKKPREMGLGAFPQISLAGAREQRDKWRKVLSGGQNPIDARRAATGRGKTFGACVGELLDAKSSQWRNDVHRGQWRTTLETYAAPLYDLAVDKVDTEAVLQVLRPAWSRIPETASRLRGRIEAVLNYARARGWRAGENPAVWRGHLDGILPKRGKLSRGHHAAMNYRDLPEFIGRLREHPGVSAKALEFAILTAARTGEVLGARWDEFDSQAKVWTIPANRMKAGSAHRIPLSDRAIEILTDLQKPGTGEFLFPGRRPGTSMSRWAAWRVLGQMGDEVTVHGFRSSFRDWAGDKAIAPREICEAALAHSVGNATEAAYWRSDSLERRRDLMDSWALFCEPTPTGNVVPLRSVR